MTIQRSSARQKGRRLELAAARALGAKRTPLSGAAGGSDVTDGRFSIECKARSRLPALIEKAFGQAVGDIAFGDPRVPLVILKADRQEPIYCVRESVFLNLLAESESGPTGIYQLREKLRSALKLIREVEEGLSS